MSAAFKFHGTMHPSFVGWAASSYRLLYCTVLLCVSSRRNLHRVLCALRANTLYSKGRHHILYSSARRLHCK